MTRSREEYEIQVALVGHILLRAAPGLVWTATANGELRDPAVGAKLKRMGAKAGVPDLIFVRRERDSRGVSSCAYAIEFKSEKGRATPAQLDFFKEWNAALGQWREVRSVDEFIAAMQDWGIVR